LAPKAIGIIGRRYQEGCLDGALHEKQRTGAAPVLDDSQKQRIIAMVCSDPPDCKFPLTPLNVHLSESTNSLTLETADACQRWPQA
jgi:hypothetical protein